jgi:hypothetical protein
MQVLLLFFLREHLAGELEILLCGVSVEHKVVSDALHDHLVRLRFCKIVNVQHRAFFDGLLQSLHLLRKRIALCRGRAEEFSHLWSHLAVEVVVGGHRMLFQVKHRFCLHLGAVTDEIKLIRWRIRA